MMKTRRRMRSSGVGGCLYVCTVERFCDVSLISMRWLSVDENPGLRLAAGFLALSTRSPVMFGWALVCGFSM